MSRQNWNDDPSELETELRRNRPTPRSIFLHSLSARIEDLVGTPEAPKNVTRASRPRLRFGLAVGFATVFLAVFASFGGLGYAKSSVQTLSSGAPHLFSHLVNGNTSHATSSSRSKSNTDEGGGGGDNGDDNSAEHEYPDDDTVCVTNRHGESQIVVLKQVANRLISNGTAHRPPCNGD